MFSRLRTFLKTKVPKRWILAMAIFLFSFSSPAFARSGGRMGGSYYRPRAPSRGPSMSRPLRSSRPIYYSPPRRIIYHAPPLVHQQQHSPVQVLESPTFARPRHQRRGIGLSEVVLVTGTGMAITYKVMDHYQKYENKSLLGPGVSVASFTFAMQVPDRTDPDCILLKLNNKAQTARTDSRNGLQNLVSEVALELLRKESTITSVKSSVSHYRSMTEAQRAFQQESVRQRSKFDRESVSNFDGLQSLERKSTPPPSKSGDSYTPLATMAVVNLSLCIEGMSFLKQNNLKSRRALGEALSQIASDSQVEDCLLSAEILWTPEDPLDESLSETDVYMDYPDLYFLVD